MCLCLMPFLSVYVCASQLAALTAQYPSFFKKSSACNRPHLFADKLRDDLFKAKVRASLPAEHIIAFLLFILVLEIQLTCLLIYFLLFPVSVKTIPVENVASLNACSFPVSFQCLITYFFIFRLQVVSSNNLNTDAELLGWLMLRNSELEQRSDQEWLDLLKGNEKGKVKRKLVRNINSYYCCLLSSISVLVWFQSSYLFCLILFDCFTYSTTRFLPFVFSRFLDIPRNHRNLRSRSAAKPRFSLASIPRGLANTRTTTTAKATTIDDEMLNRETK